MTATVYIAGPMSGYKNFNYEAFDKAETTIGGMALDYGLELEVINPANNFDGRQDLPYEQYLELAEEQVSQADVVVLLDGWQESKGVSREMEVAQKTGSVCIPFEDYTGVHSPRNEKDPEAVLPQDEQDDGLGFGPCVANGDWTLIDEGCDCVKAQGERCSYCLGEMTPPAESTLEEAQRLVLGDRQSSYSHPHQDFRTTGRQWAALIENWLKSEEVWDIDIPDIPPRIVALCMAALKASREAQKPKRDNRVDGAGYWFCAERIVEDF
jgi:hypothetical protein